MHQHPESNLRRALHVREEEEQEDQGYGLSYIVNHLQGTDDRWSREEGCEPDQRLAY